jgi:glycosyltransferase involved in cell wall biosynthesis
VRIAYITETWPPEINGVALTASRTVAHLRERGHEVLLVRPRQQGERGPIRAGSDTALLVFGMPIPMYKEARFGVPRPNALRRLFIEQRPDLIHVATEGLLGYVAVRTAVALAIPVTSDFRTRFDVYTRFYAPAVLTRVVNRYLRKFHNRCALTFCPTAELQRQLSADGFERVHVSARGVDCNVLSPLHRSEALRDTWQASGPVALYVGRLAREKNLDLVISAYRAMKASQPQLRLVIVGDGPMRAELKERQPDAIFAGMLRGAELYQHYASADVFLFPSLSETFGNVTLEALASGLAVLAYDSAAAGVHIKSGVNGLVVAPGDEGAFCAAAVRLAENALLRRRLSVAARQTAVQLDWSQILDRFTAELEHVRLDQPLGVAALAA